MKALFLALALLLLAPLAVLGGDQTVPNGVQRIGAADFQVGSSDDVLDYADINVAVVDTGIDLENSDLNVVGGVDCTQPPEMGWSSTLPLLGAAPFQIQAYDSAGWAEYRNPDATGYEDGMGHGTHVSGILGARDDDRGVVGVAPNVSLWSVRVLDGNGGGTLDSIVCGLNWIHDHRDITNIEVVNMSLGGSAGTMVMDHEYPCHVDGASLYLPPITELFDDPIHEAICQLYDDGIVVVVAAGNGAEDAGTSIPAAYPEVFTVSNLVDTDGLPGGLGGRVDTTACPFGGYDDMLFSYLNFTLDRQYSSFNGYSVDFAAPGTCVLSTVPGGFAGFTGTSMASPHVAGVVARYLSDHRTELAGRERNWVFVEYVRLQLLLASETQTGGFGDSDSFHEPIIHVVGK
jgi:subtilisin